MQNLLQNKTALAIIGALILALIIFIFFVIKPFDSKSGDVQQDQTLDKDVKIMTTDDAGKALEVQALMARQGITLDKESEGQKNNLIIKKGSKKSEVDRAIVAIVQSGLMDKNIGLEIFDKGDFTSSKEDKRIRLARAINGELSRLIKRIPPVIDASVFVAIPEPTIFTAFKKPLTATVQVTLPLGDKLDRDKERAIINLLIGSVQGLDAKNISLTDTNGNVYKSMMDPSDDMMSLLEENDQYMKKKVMVQLDRLLGPGKYVVTVSTFLRETPVQTEKLIYKPEDSSVSSKQLFKENLGDTESEKRIMSGAVSSFIPGGLPGGPKSDSDRKYARSAEEVQYGMGKTQISETKEPGMIEDITIALTLDKGAIPADMKMEDLQTLIANAASPKVNPKNVKIAFNKPMVTKMAPETTNEVPKVEESGNPWYAVAVALGLLLILGLLFIWFTTKSSESKQQKQITDLKDLAIKQEELIKATQNQAAQISNNQENLYGTLREMQNTPAISAKDIKTTLQDLRESMDDTQDEAELSKQLHNWIEAGG